MSSKKKPAHGKAQAAGAPRPSKAAKASRAPRAAGPAVAEDAPAAAVEPAWPPYGHMHAGLEAAARSGPVPQGFDESSWGAFFQQVRDEIAAVIWPRWEAGAWVGQAVARMGALTRADLDLMDTQLRRWHLQPVGAQGDLALVTHKALFTAEDDMPHSGGTFETARRYLAAQPPAVVTGVVAAAVRALGAMGPRPLAFKRELQRPRPYQAQMLLGQPFNYEWAKSAVTPSIMSGHCLQGVFAATWSYVDQQQQIETLPGARLALQKFGVDFGDRRVFAGVHYPSDNVASWYIGLKLADVCFGSQAGPARCFMADAIRLSRVYTAMKQAAVDAGSPYGVLLTWVDGAM